MAAPPQFPLRCPTVEVKEVGPGHALVDSETDAVHVINDTALALWELCDGTTSPAEMVDAICALFAIDRAGVEEDVDRTLQEFRRLGVISWEAALAP